ncbi:MAG: YbaB/EbfC family nucleoid-associated protein [Alphaproteobacteria bacterium]
MAKGFEIPGLGDLMEQATAMHERLARTQSEVGERTVEATVGGGMVTARMNGRLELLSISIAPEVIASGDREMLQDMVAAAVNEAVRRAQSMMAEEMKKITGGLRIPGLG